MIINGIDYEAREKELKAAGVNPDGSDSEFGDVWIHCNQHGRIHTTGWCTVSNLEKRAMSAENYEEAKAEAEGLGLWFADAGARS